ncbi:MAG: M15 family metallopeptidase [Alistipes sp.]|nr:M15 family metallopeptidase [Alistipes sp.]
MYNYINVTINFIIALIMCACNIQSTEVENLKKWNAGAVVTTKAIKIYGEDNVFVSSNITKDIYERIYGKSYKIDCTIPLTDLCYLKILHYDIAGNIRIGEMICNKMIANDLISIFRELYKAKYPIERMILIDEYNANDEVSMSNNNSSSFNYRMITGGGKLSKHALGLAVDINPLYNPYVKILPNGQLHVEPHNAQLYVDRRTDFDYKIDSSDLCYKLFTQYGFEWGGDWETRKDYQHFEKR